jgi:phosphate/phosphite/phosphonate ABC transporter binding protein
MLNGHKKTIVLSLAALLFATTAMIAFDAAPSFCQQPAIKVLKVGRIPYLDPRKMVNDHQKILQYLKKELNIEDARLVLTPNYDELNKFLKEGQIDIAWHGTLNYPQARMTTGAKTILMPKRFNKTSYKGMIVVRSDSNINTIADLKGKSFAFVDKKSASGYFFPKILMLENNIDPDKDISRIEYMKKHDNILYNILYKKFDAGAVYEDARELLKTDEQRAQIKILAKTAEILNEPIMVRSGLDPEFEKKIVEAFLKLNKDNPETAHVIEMLGNVESFVVAADKDYDEIVTLTQKYQKIFAEESRETKEVKLNPSLCPTEVTGENEVK